MVVDTWYFHSWHDAVQILDACDGVQGVLGSVQGVKRPERNPLHRSLLRAAASPSLPEVPPEDAEEAHERAWRTGMGQEELEDPAAPADAPKARRVLRCSGRNAA